ncbi:MAG TPA: asparagine synthase C-terminal domain-containing protein, partial [Kofleriaceae bacterium]|nr:asparagine synthase C-terminal domain-containing protein [Kofleriaceae bacterium]
KPIYYVDQPDQPDQPRRPGAPDAAGQPGGGLFAYASEFPVLASLLSDPEAHLDHASLAWYFSQKTTPGDRSIDARIRKLPAGHLLRRTADGRVTIERWWSIAPGRVPVRPDVGEPEIADEIERLLTSSVRLRMRADTEVGAFLSGGVDSSLCVALASRCTDRPLKTYCLVYDQEINHKSADRRWARAIAERYATRHREILLTPALLAEDLPRIVRHYGQPNSAVLSNWFISREMGKELKVAISGDGADELFGSYFLHRAAAAAAALDAGDAAALARIPTAEADFARAHRGRPHAVLADAFAVFPDEELRRLAPRLAVPCLAMLEAHERELATRHPIDRALEFDCRNLLVDQILTYSDTLSMAHSLEVRTPFLDHRLVDTLFSIPAELKLRPGETKRLLKQVARRHLPEELVARPKEGFVEPAVYWIGDELADFCHAYLLSSAFNRMGLVDSAYVRDLVLRFARDKDFATGKKVWNLLVYAIWEAQLGAG